MDSGSKLFSMHLFLAHEIQASNITISLQLNLYDWRILNRSAGEQSRNSFNEIFFLNAGWFVVHNVQLNPLFHISWPNDKFGIHCRPITFHRENWCMRRKTIKLMMIVLALAHLQCSYVSKELVPNKRIEDICSYVRIVLYILDYNPIPICFLRFFSPPTMNVISSKKSLLKYIRINISLFPFVDSRTWSEINILKKMFRQGNVKISSQRIIHNLHTYMYYKNTYADNKYLQKQDCCAFFLEWKSI